MHGLIELLNADTSNNRISTIVDKDPSTWPYKYQTMKDAPQKHIIILRMIRAPEMSVKQICDAARVSKADLMKIVHHPPNRKFLETYNNGVVGDLQKIHVGLDDMARTGLKIQQRFFGNIDKLLDEAEDDPKLLKELNPIIRTVHQITKDAMNRNPTGELSPRKAPEASKGPEHLTSDDMKKIMKLARAMQDNAEPIEAEFVEIDHVEAK